MKLRMRCLTIVAATFAVGIGGPVVGLAGQQSSQEPSHPEKSGQSRKFQKESETSMTLAPDRGNPGLNAGGQAVQPGEGEQSGRPGTIFGGPASLPPQDEAVQYEGADQGRKNPPSTKSESSVPF